MKMHIAILALLLLTGCWDDQQRATLKADGCIPNGREELQERVYCGKACTRPKIREWYLCGKDKNDQQKTIPTWFEY